MADQLITKRTPCCGSALSAVTDQGDCRSCGAYVSGLDSRLRAEFAAQARRVTASARTFTEAERAARLTSDVAIDELTQYRRHLETTMKTKAEVPPPLERIVVAGEARLLALIPRLVSESVWFSVTPYPDDEWKIEVKRESAHLLMRLFYSQPGATR